MPSIGIVAAMVLVAVSITETVCADSEATYKLRPSGVRATPTGRAPTWIVVTSERSGTLMTEMLPPPVLATKASVRGSGVDVIVAVAVAVAVGVVVAVDVGVADGVAVAVRVAVSVGVAVAVLVAVTVAVEVGVTVGV